MKPAKFRPGMRITWGCPVPPPYDKDGVIQEVTTVLTEPAYRILWDKMKDGDRGEVVLAKWIDKYYTYDEAWLNDKILGGCDEEKEPA